MITITVARRPVEGTVAGNAVKFGTGAMNIDDTRIGSTKRVPGSLSHTDNVVYGKYGQETGEESGHNPNIGRWPANIILEHKPGCCLVGTSKVKGNRTDTRPEGDGGRDDKSQWRFRPTEAVEVPVWECVDGCPVKALDEQSGESLSSGGVNAGTLGNRVYGKYSGERIGGTAGGMGDFGGASRFFFTCQIYGEAGASPG